MLHHLVGSESGGQGLARPPAVTADQDNRVSRICATILRQRDLMLHEQAVSRRHRLMLVTERLYRLLARLPSLMEGLEISRPDLYMVCGLI